MIKILTLCKHKASDNKASNSSNFPEIPYPDIKNSGGMRWWCGLKRKNISFKFVFKKPQSNNRVMALSTKIKE